MSLTKFDVNDGMKPLIDHMALGSDEALKDQLIAKSKQPNISKYTPKDATVRFVNNKTFDEWKSKGRTVFWLIGRDNDLAGIVWFGSSEYPLQTTQDNPPSETFAIRLYEGYTGHGLAVPFIKLALKAYVTMKLDNKDSINGIWLETDLANPAAIAVYTKVGFKEVYRDELRVTMVLSVSDIKRIAKNY